MTALPRSCASCGEHACPLNQEALLGGRMLDRTAFILGRHRPEFAGWLDAGAPAPDQVFLAWRPQRRAQDWAFCGRAALTRLVWPSLTQWADLCGRTAAGRPRQAVFEAFDRRFAKAAAKRLPTEVLRLVVSQDFVAFLHREKALGGRRYDVLAHRPPRRLLHEQLDAAARRWPELVSLREFRSPPAVVRDEDEALAGAERIVTASRFVAGLHPDRAVLIPRPSVVRSEHAPGRRIAFLGPTLARRGAGLTRSAMHALGQPLVVVGANLEDPDFWRGVSIEPRAFEPGWTDGLGLLLAPGFTDCDAERIEQALARGIEVIASPICGLEPQPGLHLVDPLDEAGFCAGIEGFVERSA